MAIILLIFVVLFAIIFMLRRKSPRVVPRVGGASAPEYDLGATQAALRHIDLPALLGGVPLISHVREIPRGIGIVHGVARLGGDIRVVYEILACMEVARRLGSGEMFIHGARYGHIAVDFLRKYFRGIRFIVQREPSWFDGGAVIFFEETKDWQNYPNSIISFFTRKDSDLCGGFAAILPAFTPRSSAQIIRKGEGPNDPIDRWSLAELLEYYDVIFRSYAYVSGHEKYIGINGICHCADCAQLCRVFDECGCRDFGQFMADLNQAIELSGEIGLHFRRKQQTLSDILSTLPDMLYSLETYSSPLIPWRPTFAQAWYLYKLTATLSEFYGEELAKELMKNVNSSMNTQTASAVRHASRKFGVAIDSRVVDLIKGYISAAAEPTEIFSRGCHPDIPPREYTKWRMLYPDIIIPIGDIVAEISRGEKSPVVVISICPLVKISPPIGEAKYISQDFLPDNSPLVIFLAHGVASPTRRSIERKYSAGKLLTVSDYPDTFFLNRPVLVDCAESNLRLYISSVGVSLDKYLPKNETDPFILQK